MRKEPPAVWEKISRTRYRATAQVKVATAQLSGAGMTFLNPFTLGEAGSMMAA
jgi:hypothetical protein